MEKQEKGKNKLESLSKVFSIAFILNVVICSGNIKAQVPDTLAYMQQVVNNKAQFVGKPFSVLMDSLKIYLKFFTPGRTEPFNKNKEVSTFFSFVFPETAEDMYLAYPMLYINWQTSLNAVQIDELYRQNDGGGWSPQVSAFFANAIVSDIRIFE